MSIQEDKMDMNASIGLEMAVKGRQITEQRGGLRGLGWIKPEMMQQVFSSVAFSQGKRESAQFENQMELLKLFPESRTAWEKEKIAPSYPPFSISNEVTENRSVSGKQSTSQLTIFYKGAVNVYHVSADKAQAVMKLADSCSSLSEKTSLKPSHSENQHAKKLAAGLPMARKLSLQRFLQKRKDRLGNLNPYTSTDMKGSWKVWAEEDVDKYNQISLSLSFPSQRSG